MASHFDTFGTYIGGGCGPTRGIPVSFRDKVRRLPEILLIQVAYTHLKVNPRSHSWIRLGCTTPVPE